jgi:hypothetical protein
MQTKTWTYDDIYRRLDEVLSSRASIDDVRKFNRIAARIVSHMTSMISKESKLAVDGALNDWKTLGADGRDELVRHFGERLDQKKGGHDSAINRLLFGAVGRNTGLDTMSGELLVDLAREVGCSANIVASAFQDELPEF